MKKLFLGYVSVILSFSAVSTERSDDFWNKCPGPACPSHLPGSATDTNARTDSIEKKERDMDRREHGHSAKRGETPQQIYRTPPTMPRMPRDRATQRP